MPLRHRVLLAILLAVGPWSALVPPRVTADCQPSGPLEEELRTAEIAFVGRVVATDGPIARFAVAEVWAGEVAAEAEVRGLSDEPARPGEAVGRPAAIVGEDDRTWEPGATYLVLPFVDGVILRDHLCTATTPWVDELADLRPAGARIVEPGAGRDGAPPTPIILMLAALAGVAVLSALVFRSGADRSDAG